MQERGWIEPILERVVGEVLDSHMAQLRAEIVRRVREEIAALPAAVEEPAAQNSAKTAANLAQAVAEIQLGSSQREILRALLDTSTRYAARVALFVVKGSHATGWQGRGFVNSDAVKDFALDENAPAIRTAISDRAIANVPVSGLDARFLGEFGVPASGDGQILPLILKDKVAALLYADGGAETPALLDAGSLELLVLATSAWLEVSSLRKQVQKESSGAHAETASAPASMPSAGTPSPAVAPAAPAFNDPFAAHAPAFASGLSKAAAATAGEASGTSAAVATSIPPTAAVAEKGSVESQSTAPAEMQSAVAEMEPAPPEPLPIGHTETTSTEAPAALSAISAEEQEVLHKAQRFARLLVDEIKLYNQAKVAEGRKNKDLYDRLKDTIEKSRATYQKRYGNTIASSGNYFHHEIIRSLAEDDLSIMGANFRQ